MKVAASAMAACRSGRFQGCPSPVQVLRPQFPMSLDAYIHHRPAAGSWIADPPQVDVFGSRSPLVTLAGCSRNLNGAVLGGGEQ